MAKMFSKFQSVDQSRTGAKSGLDFNLLHFIVDVVTVLDNLRNLYN